MEKSTTKKFIEKAQKVHNYRYDYSKVKYINNKTKVCIICPEHGEFWQKPNNHLHGQNCPECARKKLIIHSRKVTTNDFIIKYKEKYGDRYEIGKEAVYINNRTPIKMICHHKGKNGNEHGVFYAKPNSLLRGHGCQKCYNERRSKTQLYTTEQWINLVKRTHGDNYDYSKVIYKNSHMKVCVICNKCKKEFWQLAYDHLNGKGCPFCKSSKSENFIDKYLKSKNIFAKRQHTFDWLKTSNGTHQYLDFYLPEYNIAIECQGEQHFFPVDFGNNGKEYAEKQFLKTQLRDKNKLSLCNKNSIEILYINYNDTEAEKIEKLNKALLSL